MKNYNLTKDLRAVLALCIISSLLPLKAYSLGISVQFKHAKVDSSGVVALEYRHGFNKRVVKDDDGHATLIALLSSLKGEYFISNSSVPKETDSVKKWREYKHVMKKALDRMVSSYEKLEVCEHTEDFVRKYCTDLKNLNLTKSSNNPKWSDIFQLSDLLKRIDDDNSPLKHNYDFVRYNGKESGEGYVVHDTVEKKAAYMLSADRLTPWLPSERDYAKCAEHYKTGEGFLSSLQKSLTSLKTEGASRATPSSRGTNSTR